MRTSTFASSNAIDQAIHLKQYKIQYVSTRPVESHSRIIQTSILSLYLYDNDMYASMGNRSLQLKKDPRNK